jgi:hypothetical protein
MGRMDWQCPMRDLLAVMNEIARAIDQRNDESKS